MQSATSMDTAVFCGICDNYGIYGGTVGLLCISFFFLIAAWLNEVVVLGVALCER